MHIRAICGMNQRASQYMPLINRRNKTVIFHEYAKLPYISLNTSANLKPKLKLFRLINQELSGFFQLEQFK
jgi:hypothetical protein